MTFEVKGLDRVVKDLKSYNKFNAKATSRALNDGSRKAVTRSLREAKKPWVGLKTGDFKKHARLIEKSKVSTLQTQFKISSKSINLLYFGAKWQPRTPTGKRTKGVSYRLKNKRRTMKGSFIAKGYVFTRRSDTDEITAHFSITPTSMFESSGGVGIYKIVALYTFTQRYYKYLEEGLKNFR